MEKNKLKELVIEHKGRFLLKDGLIKRDIQDKIKGFIKQREIVLITDIRRSGKSSLMRLICGDIMRELNIASSTILYLNFEDERFIDFSVKDFQVLGFKEQRCDDFGAVFQGSNMSGCDSAVCDTKYKRDKRIGIFFSLKYRNNSELRQSEELYNGKES